MCAFKSAQIDNRRMIRNLKKGENNNGKLMCLIENKFISTAKNNIKEYEKINTKD